MKNRIVNIFLVLIVLVGLSLLLYPSVSNYINELHSSRAIHDYIEQIKTVDTEAFQESWSEAVEYNQALLHNPNRLQPSKEEYAYYESLLDLTGTGIMGTIDIPSIDVSLPLYHGTDEAVLQVAVGHIAGTSLPTGGTGTHCVVSGHRGLPSARLFTDLDKVQVGDLFTLSILEQTMTYQVDKILVVEPWQVEAMQIDPEQDYCTLVTCTPYGINTHRLLVRGHRVANVEEKETVHVTADAVQIEPVIVAPVVAAPMLLLLLIVVFTRRKK